MIVPPDLIEPITAIHAAPHRLVLAFAGAGSLGLAWLHAIAGSSRTILEAIDAYSPPSLAQLTGNLAAPAVSALTAQAMATWAYQRAQALSSGEWPLPRSSPTVRGVAPTTPSSPFTAQMASLRPI